MAPDGSPDPSIFSTEGDPVGIRVGTAIATLVRKDDHLPAAEVGFRHLLGKAKPAELIDTAEAEPGALYDRIEPALSLVLPFVRTRVSKDWFDWPALPGLFPVSFPGIKSGRDPFVVDIDLDRLKGRIADYFDVSLSHEEIGHRYPTAMRNPREYDSRSVRDALLIHGDPADNGFLRYAFRPFDNRWLYWENRAKLVDRPRLEFRPHVFKGNMWLSAAQHLRKGAEEPQSCFTEHIASLHLIERGANMFPAYLSYDGKEHETKQRPWNLTIEAANYLRYLSADVEDLFHHVLVTLHDPGYREANAGALKMGWPRIPLRDWPDGKTCGAAKELAESASRGRELARLLDPEALVPGVTAGDLRPEIASIAVPATGNGNSMSGDDFVLAAGWGRFGSGEAVMPGQGRVEQRKYTADEVHALGGAKSVLGESTFDIYLNENAFWRNVPAAIWNYKLGGYQVLKKWLSYRENKVLGRALKPEEVGYFAEVARRIAGILMLTGRSNAEVG